MTETINDVAEWLRIALQAVYLDDANLQKCGHKPYTLKLDHKHEGEGDNIGLNGLVEFDAFTISPARWEDVNGLLQNRRAVEGWLVEVTVPRWRRTV
jgi:hypothetical protein